ncbi:MAG: phage tail protein, partial [Ancalomicrobiaceae bacterium]|nr:phage tail protein [Ancalomicrobiaceae bacterium]
MTGFLRLGSRTNNPAHADFALRIQSSLQGRPKAIGAGQNRLTGNVPWTGDFSASPAKSGGKGGSGSTGKGSTGTYNYSSSFILSLGDGPIVGVQSIINGNAIDFLVTPPASVLADLEALGISPTYGNIYGATFILGSYTQAPWSFLTSNHPTQALAYRGEALACFANFGLGNSASLPNFSFEILWGINSDIPALGPDANPADWITAALTNADWGVGFPTTLLDGLTDYRTWCRALSMMISPVLTGQTALQSHLSDLMTGTAADFVWSGGKLTIAPYADQTVSGNGYTYVPVVTPIYDLTTGDFLVNQGSLGNESGDTPIASSRKDPQLVPNRLPLEYLDRSNLYNPVTIYESDDVSIVASNRLRAADLRSHHFFCLAAAASSSAALQMQREKVQTTYQFTLPAQFIRLEPVKDIVTLTDPYLGLNRQPVRITEKTENSDRSLTFVAEEFLGYAAPPLYARQKSLGSARNINVEPGLLNPPILFEPPDQLAGALEIWAAVSGQNTALWGGCKVWVSYDPAGTFIEVADVASPARMGVLTASLPSISANLAGQTIDNTNTLAVSLAESAGALASGSTIDMTGLTTVCFVDGEIIAYQTATLTGANAYSLAPLVRGAYASTIATHAAASSFARLDDAIGKVRFTQDRIGSTIYLKFQSYNIYGGGVQDLSTLASYSYAITGAALASPLPTPTNLRTVFSSGVTHLY